MSETKKLSPECKARPGGAFRNEKDAGIEASTFFQKTKSPERESRIEALQWSDRPKRYEIPQAPIETVGFEYP